MHLERPWRLLQDPCCRQCPVRSGVAKGDGGDAGLQLAQAGTGTTTRVPPEVVTGTRIPPDVTTVKPAVLGSDTVPRTAPHPGGGVTRRAPFPLVGPGGGPTMTEAAAIVPSE